MTYALVMFCKRCQYPLKQLQAARCPECGDAFNPNDPTTFAAKRFGDRWRIHSTIVLVVLALWCFVSMKSASPNTSWEHHSFAGPSIVLKTALESQHAGGLAFGLVMLASVFAPAGLWVIKGRIWAGILALVMAAMTICISILAAISATI